MRRNNKEAVIRELAKSIGIVQAKCEEKFETSSKVKEGNKGENNEKRKAELELKRMEGYVIQDVKCTNVARLGKYDLNLIEIVKFFTQGDLPVFNSDGERIDEGVLSQFEKEVKERIKVRRQAITYG
ncbi:hypothetical protein Tco_0432983 [Tanacetum coccineum]